MRFCVLFGQLEAMNKILTCAIMIIGILMTSRVNANVYNFSFNSINGKEINLNEFKGKPIFIVNTASLCGFTYQYSDIESLYQRYKKDGLIIIGIPSNDFGNQELSSNQKVKEFCSVNFDISFILTEITSIKGEKGHPFFKWIKKEAGFLAFPKWNFYKYIINKEGMLVKWYSSTTRPNSNKVTQEIEKIISQ